MYLAIDSMRSYKTSLKACQMNGDAIACTFIGRAGLANGNLRLGGLMSDWAETFFKLLG